MIVESKSGYYASADVTTLMCPKQFSRGKGDHQPAHSILTQSDHISVRVHQQGSLHDVQTRLQLKENCLSPSLSKGLSSLYLTFILLLYNGIVSRIIKRVSSLTVLFADLHFCLQPPQQGFNEVVQ